MPLGSAESVSALETSFLSLAHLLLRVEITPDDELVVASGGQQCGVLDVLLLVLG